MPAENMPSIVGDLVFEDVVESKLDWRLDEIYEDKFVLEGELIRALLRDNETGAECNIVAKNVHFDVVASKGYEGRDEFFFDKYAYKRGTNSLSGEIAQKNKDEVWEVVAVVPEGERYLGTGSGTS
ncbi:MAG: hypothetical protein ACKVQS_06530 [Fimbriimonadaceae bacterium]